jgi:hypothetical protein
MAKVALKEGDIIQALKRALPEGQLVRFNPGPMSPRGISDVLITWNGRDWFCEIKVNDTKLTRLQAEFLRKRANPILMQVDTRKSAVTCEAHQQHHQDVYWITSMMVKQLCERVGTYDIRITVPLKF